MTEKLDQQAIFDIVSNHLLTQGERAQRPTFWSSQMAMCAYFNQETGLKCAVGCLIPEERYHPDLEGWSLMSVSVKTALDLDRFVDPDLALALLHDLQSVHDDALPDQWRTALEDVADAHGLKFHHPS